MTWSAAELDALGASPELEVAVRRDDGTLRRWTPVWVVRAGDGVYVRTWYRRESGWYGAALRSRRARVRVPGLEADVDVEDVGSGAGPLREEVDAAYRDKYGGGDGGSGRMVADEAAATTLRLRRAPQAQPVG